MKRLQGPQAPTTAADYERLVLSSPNSSFLWIKYMAWLIQLGDVDKARALAERALKTINYREDGEKFNIWVAMLNLENAYGQPDPDEAVMKLFGRASQYCNQKKLYLALLGVLERSSRVELGQQVMKTMCKKFGTSAKIWLRTMEAQLRQQQQQAGGGGAAESASSVSDSEAARKLLERALSVLPMRKHLKVISQTALLEFRLGSAERGRGLFESILRNYPRRLDIWSMYIDQEVKLRDQQRTRALFERATQMSMPAKKMKFLFKRFLEYEKAHGDAGSVEHVKKQAMEFVERTMRK